MKSISKVVVCAVLLLFEMGQPLAGQVLINELMYHPPSENSQEEYIEVFNSGTNEVDLSGWKFITGVRFSFPSVTLKPGAYLVVAASENAFTNKYPAVTNYVAGWDGILSNSGQLLELVDAEGNQVNSVRYADDGEWAIRARDAIDYGHRGWTWLADHDGFGLSLELINPALPNKHGQNWAASVVTDGTPGQKNSLTSSNIAPLILAVQHFPLVPKPTESVRVTARILDEITNGISAFVFYRLDGSTEFASIGMFDDGQHGDGIPNDQVFGCALPPQTNQAIVEFYVEAKDQAGNRRTWPAPALEGDGRSGQWANALYQVDASPSYSGDQPFYKLILTATEQAELQQINTNSPPAPYPTFDQTLSHAAMNATFISFDGTGSELRYLVGLRNRGNGSRLRRPQSYGVQFRQDQLWKKASGINLNTQYPYAQIAGSAIFRRSGIVAAEARPVQVRINNVNPSAPDMPTSGTPAYGYYAHVEDWGSELAARHFPNDSSGNFYRAVRLAPPGANLSYLGDDKAFYRTNYLKFTNTSADDWSDLIELTRVLNLTPDADLSSEVRRVLDVEEWMRYFAVNTLLDNNETCLANGDGDDYYVYRGVLDPRFKVLPYDLDTILGQGDSPGNVNSSLFRAAEISSIGTSSPAMQRFLKWPDFVPIYYETLLHLIETTFSPAKMGSLLDRTLAGLVPDSTLEAMKNFASARSAYVRSQIPLSLSISNALPEVSGYAQSKKPAVSLQGLANVIRTRSVLVDGTTAAWSAWDGHWTNSNVTLRPGLNRILVQALDIAGQEFDRTSMDIWYENGHLAKVSGSIPSDTIWTAAAGPYSATGNITVLAGVTLTIEPGTTIYFAAGSGITVNGGLFAEGTDTQRIRFSRTPGSPDPTNSWIGLTFSNSKEANRLSYVDIEFAGSANHSIGLDNSTVVIDHATWSGTTRTIIETLNSSLHLSQSTLPTLSGAELIHGGDIPPDGFFIIESNVFGGTTGLNDIIDFSRARRPGPVPQFLNNIFTSASDDVLDLDGCDSHVEGNIFMNVSNGDPGSGDTSSAISYGQDAGYSPSVVAVRNLFYQVDHVALAKEGGFLAAINNTAVDVPVAGVNFDEPLRHSEGVLPGRGAYLDGNILWKSLINFENYYSNDPTYGTLDVRANRSILSGVDFPTNGIGNFNVDPRLVNENTVTSSSIRNDFRLRPGSAARGAGPNGLDMGALVPAGVSISGEPRSPTYLNSATLRVGGPGYKLDAIPGFTNVYRFKVNEGPWSTEVVMDEPIQLTGLTNGMYTVYVVGKNSAGVWQEETSATASKSWIVDMTYSRLLINEILASNTHTYPHGASYPDLIELFNDSGTERDLSGFGLTDDPARKYQFMFPPGASISANGFLVLFADNDSTTPGLHTGFALKQTGDRIFLYDKAGNGGALLDSVEFGLQLQDLSVGRLSDGRWGLTKPTLGTFNLGCPTGDTQTLRINEWLTDSPALFTSGFIELYNPDSLPVDLSGLFLTDNPLASPTQYQVPALSFIGAQNFATYATDHGSDQGATRLNFSLPPEQGEIGLFAPDQTEIDMVLYRSQAADVSEGRSPSGSDHFAFFQQPTPGAGNPGSKPSTNVITQTVSLLSMTNQWKYDPAGIDLGTIWQGTNYDDGSWLAGEALFYHPESTDLPAPKNSFLPFTTPRQRTFYFRSRFFFPGDTSGAVLRISHIIDDGAVCYLNGVELYRFNMPPGIVRYTDFSTSTISTASLLGPFIVPANNLLQGENLLAVEVHQRNENSSDAVFGLSLEALVTVTNAIRTQTPLVLNEIVAQGLGPDGGGALMPDWVELYNPNTNALEVSEMSLSDDPGNPRRWVFPSGSIMPPESFLVIEFDHSKPSSPTNTGFGLDAQGDRVYLFDRLNKGGALVDAVTFGLQARGYSIGRVPDADGTWALSSPTRAALNSAAALGTASALKINEWMANPPTGDDWLEIHNPGAEPVELDGLYLSDDLNNRSQHKIAPLSFIGSGSNGYVKFEADGAPEKGANHVNFKLSAKGDSIGLFSRTEELLDSVTFGPQDLGISEGRLPDGAAVIVKFTTPTPRGANQIAPFDSDGDGLPDDWENANGFDPGNPIDASLDPDGDGLTNLQEYLSGTDPRDGRSSLRIYDVTPSSTGSWILHFTAVAGRTYTVQFRDALDSGGWERLIDINAQTSTRTLEIEDPLSGGLPGRYYRVMTPRF